MVNQAGCQGFSEAARALQRGIEAADRHYLFGADRRRAAAMEEALDTVALEPALAPAVELVRTVAREADAPRHASLRPGLEELSAHLQELGTGGISSLADLALRLTRTVPAAEKAVCAQLAALAQSPWDRTVAGLPIPHADQFALWKDTPPSLPVEIGRQALDRLNGSLTPEALRKLGECCADLVAANGDPAAQLIQRLSHIATLNDQAQVSVMKAAFAAISSSPAAIAAASFMASPKADVGAVALSVLPQDGWGAWTRGVLAARQDEARLGVIATGLTAVAEGRPYNLPQLVDATASLAHKQELAPSLLDTLRAEAPRLDVSAASPLQLADTLAQALALDGAAHLQACLGMLRGETLAGVARAFAPRCGAHAVAKAVLDIAPSRDAALARALEASVAAAPDAVLDLVDPARATPAVACSVLLNGCAENAADSLATSVLQPYLEATSQPKDAVRLFSSAPSRAARLAILGAFDRPTPAIVAAALGSAESDVEAEAVMNGLLPVVRDLCPDRGDTIDYVQSFAALKPRETARALALAMEDTGGRLSIATRLRAATTDAAQKCAIAEAVLKETAGGSDFERTLYAVTQSRFVRPPFKHGAVEAAFTALHKGPPADAKAAAELAKTIAGAARQYEDSAWLLVHTLLPYVGTVQAGAPADGAVRLELLSALASREPADVSKVVDALALGLDEIASPGPKGNGIAAFAHDVAEKLDTEDALPFGLDALGRIAGTADAPTAECARFVVDVLQSDAAGTLAERGKAMQAALLYLAQNPVTRAVDGMVALTTAISHTASDQPRDAAVVGLLGERAEALGANDVGLRHAGRLVQVFAHHHAARGEEGLTMLGAAIRALVGETGPAQVGVAAVKTLTPGKSSTDLARATVEATIAHARDRGDEAVVTLLETVRAVMRLPIYVDDCRNKAIAAIVAAIPPKIEPSTGTLIKIIRPAFEPLIHTENRKLMVAVLLDGLIRIAEARGERFVPELVQKLRDDLAAAPSAEAWEAALTNGLTDIETLNDAFLHRLVGGADPDLAGKIEQRPDSVVIGKIVVPRR